MTKAEKSVVSPVLRRMEQKTKEIEKCRRWAAEAASDRERRRWLGYIPEVSREQNMALGAALALQVALQVDLEVEIHKAMGWPPPPPEPEK